MSASTPRRAPRRVAVIGGGWAGLAAAVECVARGDAVTVYEMARHFGGRARRLPPADDLPALDNGQHILIGAYSETLRLMKAVGVDETEALHRMPLTLIDARGRGLVLPHGPAASAFARGVMNARGWSVRERLALLATAGGWMLRGFRCEASWTVARLARGLPPSVRSGLIEPLCVAALNTPADRASAQVFLRVLRDALFGGRGASDLLLPRVDLGALFPDAAVGWLRQHGARVSSGARVEALSPQVHGWQVQRAVEASPPAADTFAPAGSSEGIETREGYDRVLLACSAVEAARLALPHAPEWSRIAAALRYEPIVTVLLRAPGARLPAPMLALQAGAETPAQYVFDLGQLRDASREPDAAGLLAFVISGAAECIARGLDLTAQQVQAQARAQLGDAMPADTRLVRVLSEKRATFLCTPGLERPASVVAPGLQAAGDYVAGPYPATLEGAVRAGVAAARAD